MQPTSHLDRALALWREQFESWLRAREERAAARERTARIETADRWHELRAYIRSHPDEAEPPMARRPSDITAAERAIASQLEEVEAEFFARGLAEFGAGCPTHPLYYAHDVLVLRFLAFDVPRVTRGQWLGYSGARRLEIEVMVAAAAARAPQPAAELSIPEWWARLQDAGVQVEQLPTVPGVFGEARAGGVVQIAAPAVPDRSRNQRASNVR